MVATSSASSRPDSLRCAPGAGILAERSFQVAQHEAALGATDGRAADRDVGGNRVITLAGTRGQQDLCALQPAGGMLAATQHSGELPALLKVVLARSPNGYRCSGTPQMPRVRASTETIAPHAPHLNPDGTFRHPTAWRPRRTKGGCDTVSADGWDHLAGRPAAVSLGVEVGVENYV